MTERVWEKFLTPRDKQIFGAAGYAQSQGFGKRPALIIIDVNYNFCGDRPEPILDSVKRWPNSCGEDAWAALPHIRSLIDVFALGLLGGHITDCAHQHTRSGFVHYGCCGLAGVNCSRLGRIGFNQFGKTEIEYLCITVRGHHYVFGLEITVNDAGGVSLCQPVGGLGKVFE